MKILIGILLVMCLSSAFGQETTQQEQTAPAVTATSTGDLESAMRLYRQRRYQQAVAEFERVISADPKNAAAHYFLGYAHYQLKHHSEALAAFAKAFEADPNFDPRPYFRK